MSALLLLHGFTGAPSAWDPVLAHVTARAPIVRPTLAGHGLDPVPATTWDAEVERISRLLEVQDARDVHLAGYSMGGRFGWSLLARCARITSATLIGAHPGLTSEAERTERRARDREWSALLRDRGLDAFVDRWEDHPVFASQAELDEASLAEQRAVRRAHRAEGLADAMEAFGLAEMPRTDPAAIRVPVTLLVGSRDEGQRHAAEVIGPALAQARLRAVSGAGHNLLLERPAEVARAIDEAMGARPIDRVEVRA
ncbi:MAG: alpha/beta fold hydrolase [Sandaracinaceae bacterium]